MKKFCAIMITFCCLVSGLMGVTVSAASEEPDITVTDGCYTLDAEKTLMTSERLTDNASSVILYETNSKTLMYTYNADERTDPASLVKIMTAYIVVEECVLSDAVTVSQKTLDTVNKEAVMIDLQAGEVLTVEQLLHCMLAGSANDAAAVLAEHACGDQTAFVERMNEYAEKLGCTQTNFTNVHGLYDPEQYSTARDIARILDRAMQNETFREIFCTAEYAIPATNKSEPRELITGNYHINCDEVMIYYDERVVGGRTAVTQTGHRSLATVAQEGDMEMICVLFGAVSEIAENGYSVLVFGGYKETTGILDQGFDGRRLTQVLRKDQVLTQQSVSGGDCDVALGPVDSVFAILPASIGPEDLQYRYSATAALEAPVEKNAIVSSVEIWYNNICMAQTQLYAMNGVDTQQAVAANNTSGDETRWPVGVVIVVIVACVFAAALLSRLFRRSLNRSRRYRRDRRRSR